VGIPTTLFGGPPELGNVEKLGQSQIGFMNVFAYPLFESVAEILPGMKFGIEEIKANQSIWKKKIEQAKAGVGAVADSDRSEGFQSPRSGSPDRVFAARSPEMSHPEGLPASGSSPTLPMTPPMSTATGTPAIGSPTTSPPPSSDGIGQAVSATALQSDNPNRKAATGPPSIPTAPFHGSGRYDESTDLFANSKSTLAKPQPHGSYRSFPAALQLSASTSSISGVVSGDENVPPSQVIVPSAPPSAHGRGRVFGTQRSEPGTPATPPVASANFSRPMSMRQHSAHHSHARSSAPSNAPTFSSTVNPTSPTETQATSVATDGDELVPGSVDLDRPRSGHSSSFATSTASSNRSPGQMSTTKIPPSGLTAASPRSLAANGQVEGPNKLRKKSSRFKLDFWRRKKTPETVTP
jgi:hypothetical protein